MGISARARTLLLAYPGLAAAFLFLLFALPTMALPLVARDYYHLERAHEYAPREFWRADDFQFREYFWWPFEGYYCRFFRPLWSASVVLMYRLFALWLVPHRLLWLALHLLSIALFAAVLRRSALPPRARWVALAVYVLHPFWCSFALEPVAVGSANALVMVLLLGTLLAFMRWRDEGWRPGYALAFAGCALALLTKEIGVIIAPVLVAYDYLVPKDRGRILARHAPWCGLVALYLVFYLLVVSRNNHLRPPYYLTFETEGYAARMAHQVGLYLAQPLVIGAYHPLANVEVYMGHPAAFAALVSFAGLLYFLILRATWRLPWARFALAVLLLSIVPVLPVIVQFQEFAPAAPAVGILLGLALEQMRSRWRALLELVVFAYYGGALAISLLVSAAVALEADALLGEIRRAVPRVGPGTQLYFINTPQLAWLGEASRLRLTYQEPTLNLQHLSFDCGEVAPNPRTPLARAATGLLARVAPAAVTTCAPAVEVTSDRSFTLTLGGRSFFDSDLGRFVLQGRPPFAEGEVMRHDGFQAQVTRVADTLPRQMSFHFQAPLAAPHLVFLRWEGTQASVMRFDR